jgi:hypothetical protein
VADGIRTVSIVEPRATSSALVGPAGLFTFAQMHLRVGGWPSLAFCGGPTQAAFAWVGQFFSYTRSMSQPLDLLIFPLNGVRSNQNPHPSKTGLDGAP